MIISNIPTLSSMSMVKAKVDLYNGSTLVQTCTCGDFLSDFTITREGDTSKFFGFGVCHKLDVNLIDLNRVLTVTKDNTVEIGLGDGGEIWDAPYPTFYIAEVQRDEKSNTITGTAYDKIYWAGEYLFNDLGLEAPYTLRQVAQAIAAKLGLTLKTDATASEAFSLAYDEGANLEGTEDLRTILNAIAEVTQTIYYVTYENELYFKRLDKDGDAIASITKDDYYELNTKTPRTLALICNTTELGDNLEADIGEEGAIQYIRNNPLLEMRADIATILDNAISEVGGLTITQFDCDWVGDYLLEIGDKLALETEDGGTAYSFLLSDTITYAGTLNEITSWEYTDQQPETYANPTNIGERINQTFAKVDKVNKEITLLASDVSETKSSVAELKLTTDDIALRVESIEQGEIDVDISTDEDFIALTERVGSLEVSDTSIIASVSSNTSSITELQETTSGLDSRVEENESKISELELTDESITATVSETHETINKSLSTVNEEIESLTKEVATKVTADEVTISIKNELSNGIEKVTTTTGYTFDDVGLTVSKSGREMKTQITEDGMTVFKDTTAVLTANSAGVDAKNLSASTYLIIGTNSRFEDYSGNRTACFWIGG